MVPIGLPTIVVPIPMVFDGKLDRSNDAEFDTT